MCGHFIGFYTHSPLQHQSRALWRCSTCGRESRMPIDCCTSPLFRATPKPFGERAVVQWLHETSKRVRTQVHALFARRRRPAAPVPLAAVFASDRDNAVDDVPQVEEAECAAAAESTHVSV